MIHSSACQHALRALIYLAQQENGGNQPILGREIARAVAAPKQSLAKILHGLRHKGLVKSIKGPGGGYKLASPASHTRLLDVIEAVDGKLNLNETCILGLDRCSGTVSCALHPDWKRFREEYYRTVASMTLADAARTWVEKRDTFDDT